MAAAPVATVGAAADEAGRTRPYDYYVLGVLFTAYVLNFIDRKLPYILLEPIKRDLQLSDTQIGLIQGVAFSLVYSVAAVPIARLADEHSRKRVIAGAVVVWSAMTALASGAQTFTQFAMTRIGLAVGEAGCAPPAHAMIADYFGPKTRARAIAFFMAGGQIGTMLGLMLGGWLGDRVHWRTAFLLVAAPGLLLALLIAVTVREPVRGRLDVATRRDAGRPGALETLRLLWGRRSFRFLLAGAALYALTSVGTASFTPAYLMRQFGMSSTAIGLIYGVVIGVTGAIGAYLGGWMSDALGTRDVRWNVWAPALSIGVAAPFTIAAWLAPSAAACLGLLIIPAILGLTYVGPTYAMLQKMVSARRRTVASAIFSFAVFGVGSSLGPLCVGALSDLLAPLTGSTSLRWPLAIVSLSLILSAVCFGCAATTLKEDITPADE